LFSEYFCLLQIASEFVPQVVVGFAAPQFASARFAQTTSFAQTSPITRLSPRLGVQKSTLIFFFSVRLQELFLFVLIAPSASRFVSNL